MDSTKEKARTLQNRGGLNSTISREEEHGLALVRNAASAFPLAADLFGLELGHDDPLTLRINASLTLNAARQRYAAHAGHAFASGVVVGKHQAGTFATAVMCGQNCRTVSMPGFFVSLDLIFSSVWNGTPDSFASSSSCA